MKTHKRCINSQRGRVNLSNPHPHMLECTWTHTERHQTEDLDGRKPISFQQIAFSAASMALSVSLYACLTTCMCSCVSVWENVHQRAWEVPTFILTYVSSVPTRIYACLTKCVFLCMYVCACVCTRVPLLLASSSANIHSFQIPLSIACDAQGR